MEITTNEIMNYYAQSTVEFVDMFTHKISSGKNEINRHTTNEVCSIVFPLSGNAYFSLDGHRYKMTKGVVIHTGSQMKMSIEQFGKEPCHYAVIHYRILLEDDGKCPFYVHPFVLNVEEYDHINRQVAELLSYHTTPGHLATVKTKAYFMNLLSDLLIATQRSKKIDKEEDVSKAIHFMHTKYKEGINVSQIADLLNIERRRFAYLFERHTGMNPSSYLIELRIRHSKELLRKTNYTISQVSEDVGYDDPFYFSRVFKKYTGMSPSQFRKTV